MSNYIGHLVARALNQAEVLQARVLSLFEPSGVIERSMSNHFSKPDAQDGGQAMREPTRDLPAAHQFPTFHRGDEDRTGGTLEQSAVTAAELKPLQISPARPHSQADQSSVRSLTEQVQAVSEPSFQRDGSDKVVLPGKSSPTVMVRDGTKEIILNPEPQQESGALSMPSATNKTARRLVPVTATLAARSEVKTAQSIDPPSPTILESTAGEAIPRIRVTIGRIDVRAVMSPEVPPRKKPLPPAPRLSLEGYLKQRNGGER